MDRVSRVILMNMELMNIIKDDDDFMKWYSPNKELVFITKRYDNQLWSQDSSRYIVEISIYNNILNILIATLRFSEIDALKIIDSINAFLYDMDCQTFSDSVIYVNMDTKLDNSIIYLQRIPFNVDTTDRNCYDKSNGERNIRFNINKYSTVINTGVSIVSIDVSDEELNDLSFAIFFSCLIDIELPPEYTEGLNKNVQLMIDNGYINDNGY